MDIHIPIPDWSSGWVVAFLIYAFFTFTLGYVVSRATNNSRW